MRSCGLGLLARASAAPALLRSSTFRLRVGVRRDLAHRDVMLPAASLACVREVSLRAVAAFGVVADVAPVDEAGAGAATVAGGMRAAEASKF